MAPAVDENGLAIQDLAKLDVAGLTPLSREVIARQATINVGTIGHVAHGIDPSKYFRDEILMLGE